MKNNALLATMLFAAGSLLAADPKDTVTTAAKKLADGGNYTWKQTVDAGEGGFGGGVTQGKSAAGLTWIQTPGFAFGGGDAPPPTERLYQGTNSATKNAEGQWQTAAEIAAAAAANGGGGGFGGGRGGMFGRGALELPTTTITNLVAGVKELKDDNGALVGDLTEDAAKANVFPGGRGRGRGPGGGGPGGGGPPEPTDAKGSVKIWVKDGALVKYELKNSGKMSFGGNDMEINRTTTVEISDVGSTKVDAPADVVKKLAGN
jgi:hypothetical protein